MKSYTDLSQSKKLAKFLPLDSADMKYKEYTSSLDYSSKHCVIPSIGYPYSKDIPCFSLASLLDILPDGTNIIKDKSDTENEKYMCTVGVKDSIISTFGNNPVDACVAMIEKLNELNLL